MCTIDIKDVEEERLNRLTPLLKMIAEKIEKWINNQLKQYGITFVQLSVILQLYTSDKGNDYSMKELERIFQVSQQTAAGIVKRLEQKNLVASYLDLKDRRVKRVRLTDEGASLGSYAFSELKKNEDTLEDSLTDDERKTLVALLRKVYDYLDEQ